MTYNGYIKDHPTYYLDHQCRKFHVLKYIMKDRTFQASSWQREKTIFNRQPEKKREERAETSLVAFIKLGFSIARSYKWETQERVFKEEGLIINLSLKRGSLRKYKDYSWAFENDEKTDIFSMKADFKRDFSKTQTGFQKLNNFLFYKHISSILRSNNYNFTFYKHICYILRSNNKNFLFHKHLCCSIIIICFFKNFTGLQVSLTLD